MQLHPSLKSNRYSLRAPSPCGWHTPIGGRCGSYAIERSRIQMMSKYDRLDRELCCVVRPCWQLAGCWWFAQVPQCNCCAVELIVLLW